ncbi:DUF4956 domain-containing protein [Pseudobacteriovorax antillogorgiicola]|uniref:DUF4956 domain-containing protein n=1 Tax=Pseudobacteriovorax antillogorgiicola TaxID=1513793 RepID=A0A1Y6CDX9_9BACT|nr:DUF4956 domain-containing protein [Pseudobacteriovorax antillogorgiicola]TCS51735.1 uncharacterized protein DUF4956 [Pseudobacteriovorax antillogorgiicola]SMF49594.1 protein of unknown function [Pseudobacteriovorax antillogorgiicola]
MNSFVDTFSEMDLEAGIQGDVGSFALVMIVAILFGVLLFLLYNLYFHDNEPQDGSLARSLILLTPALTATFWMIQSSVILSLGLLGSLSFVRFRTPVKRSEDVTFIVIALAVSIACATMNFAIGAVLVGILFAFTIIRNFWTVSLSGKGRFAVVTFNTRQDTTVAAIKEAFKSVGLQSQFVSSRSYDGITSFVFNASKVSKEQHEALSVKLSEFDREASFNIFYPNDRLGV